MLARAGTRLASWILVAGVALFFLGLAVAALPALRSGFGPGLSSLPRETLLGGGVAALGALAALLGLSLYVLLPAFAGAERATRDYGSHRVVLASTLLAAVGGNLLATLYLVPALLLASADGLRAVPGTPGRPLSPLEISLLAVSLDAALLAIVYLRVVRPGAITWSRMGLGLRDLGSRVGLGLAFGGLLFLASSILQFLLDQVGIHQTQTSLFESIERASPGEFGLVLLTGAVAAPIIEEIFFRGYVFRAYLDQKGPWQAYLFSSLIFAAAHQDLAALLPLFSMALLLSLVFHRSGSLVPAIVAHALNNTIAFTLLYLGIGS